MEVLFECHVSHTHQGPPRSQTTLVWVPRIGYGYRVPVYRYRAGTGENVTCPAPRRAHGRGLSVRMMNTVCPYASVQKATHCYCIKLLSVPLSLLWLCQGISCSSSSLPLPPTLSFFSCLSLYLSSPPPPFLLASPPPPISPRCCF